MIATSERLRARSRSWWPGSLWFSLPVAFVALASLVNMLWLLAFVFHIVTGDSLYVFPRGLHDVIARLTIRGWDLSYLAVIVYNAALAAGPLLLLLVPSFRAFCQQVGEQTRQWFSVNRPLAIKLGAAIMVTLVLFAFLADYARLPYLQERVRWATDWFPLPTPIDPPLLVRTEYLLTRILDARYTFVLANVLFHVVLVAYLVAYFGGARSLVPVLLGYLAVVSHFRFLYFLNGAEGELPAAAFGLIGFLEVLRGRLTGGVFAFFAGLLFKATAGMFALPAAGLVVVRLLRREVRLSDLPWGLTLVAAAVVSLSYPGLVALYASIGPQRGALWFLTMTDRPFILGSASTFLEEFFTIYTVPFALAAAGLMFAPRDRGKLIYLFLSTFALRSLISFAGGYYTEFFVPIWGLLSAGLLVRWWEAAGQHSMSRLVGKYAAVGLGALSILGNLAWYLALPQKDEWISRNNSGWQPLIARLEREIPPRATVFFRKISPRYDLERNGRHDLTFVELPDNRDEMLGRLTKPGTIVYVSLYEDLQGADGPLGAYGYRQLARFGGVGGDRYVVLLKSQ